MLLFCIFCCFLCLDFVFASMFSRMMCNITNIPPYFSLKCNIITLFSKFFLKIA